MYVQGLVEERKQRRTRTGEKNTRKKNPIKEWEKTDAE
jgi:hypothetical protein